MRNAIDTPNLLTSYFFTEMPPLRGSEKWVKVNYYRYVVPKGTKKSR